VVANVWSIRPEDCIRAPQLPPAVACVEALMAPVTSHPERVPVSNPPLVSRFVTGPAVGVAVGVGVEVRVGVGVDIWVGVAVAVAVGVLVDVPVAVAVDVCVDVAVAVAVRVAVGVEVGVAVLLGVVVLVGTVVFVAAEVGVAVPWAGIGLGLTIKLSAEATNWPPPLKF
jgi:hypothetical protein